MQLRIISLFLILLFFGCNQPNRKVINSLLLKDDLGNEFSTAEPYRKAISLAPNLTETIYFVGAEEKLYGVTTYCKFPPEAESKEKIGDLITVDYEKVLKINPDIIFMTVEGNNRAEYEKLKSLGFNVFVTNPRNFLDIEKSILEIGKLLGKNKEAKSKVDSLNAELTEVKRTGTFPTSTALFLISVQPLIAAGRNTFIGEYLSSLKIENVIDSSEQSYPIINDETLISLNPNIIVLPKKMRSSFEEKIMSNPVLKKVKAIKKSKIVTINSDLYFKPGPRFLKALVDLKKKIGEKIAD